MRGEVVPFFRPYPLSPQMVDPNQLDTYTAADTIQTSPAKLVTGYFL